MGACSLSSIPPSACPAHRVSAPGQPGGYPDPRHLNQNIRLYRKGRPVVTEERQAAPQSHGRPRGGALTAAPDLGRGHAFPRRRHLHLRDFCCPVIAVVLFPDIEQGPAIVAEVMRSNVQVLWGQTS